MKYWGAVVAVLYALLIVVLSGPLSGVLFFSSATGWRGFGESAVSMYSTFGRWEILSLLAVALVCQAALLSVPVELSAKRPVTRRTIVPLVIATALAMALLFAGAAVSLEEVFKNEFAGGLGPLAVGVFLILWLVWAVVFFVWSRTEGPAGLVDRQSRWLFRGSILELLIAVPSHILVRQRNECCAGFMTGAGIALGLAVMLFSFGPGVYYLFSERVRRLNRAGGANGAR